MLGTYTLTPGPGDTTKVEYTLETEPVMLVRQADGGARRSRWSRRQAAKAMRRLRTILEEGRGRGRRASVAARLTLRLRRAVRLSPP